jgi:hypothetical protein
MMKREENPSIIILLSSPLSIISQDKRHCDLGGLVTDEQYST